MNTLAALLAPYAGAPIPGQRRSSSGPDARAVAELTEVLDLMADFPSNEQRARYLLSSNFMRDHGAAAAARLRILGVSTSSRARA